MASASKKSPGKMEVCENNGVVTSIPESPLSSQDTNDVDEDFVKSWKGAEFDELKKHKELKTHWKNTHVFVQYNDWTKPHPNKRRDIWDNNHVRLPCSNHSEFPKNGRILKRWSLVQQALGKPILESQALIQAILEYNKVDRWNFDGLRNFLDEHLPDSEKSVFYDAILPKMIQMALSLPEQLSQSLPLFKHGTSQKISLSQAQICSILANAFFCTFPNRNVRAKRSEFANYPSINFNGIFGESWSGPSTQYEKLKCLINYFRRRIDGVAGHSLVTYSRRCLGQAKMPHWKKSNKEFKKLRVDVNGTIEDPINQGMLEIDFANAFVGGGVIGGGCVQEEIRFLICPELIVSRLFTERLQDNEVLVIQGFERYSDYTGYASNFKFSGDHKYHPLDNMQGRIPSTLVAMDALKFRSRADQFQRNNIDRELNKAFVGFFNEDEGDEPSCIATGNWGCGAFGGDPQLKSLIQLMAAAENGRDLLYFTFGDEDLRDKIFDTYTLLIDNSITVGMLYQIIVSYSPYSHKDQSLFDHIKQCITYEADTDEEDSDIRFRNSNSVNSNPGNFERHKEVDHPRSSVENHILEKPNTTPMKNENNQPKRPKQTNITQFFKESPK